MSVVDLAEQLCEHIALLKRQHKSGTTPSFGQVDDLFDLGDRLFTAIQASPRITERELRPVACSVRGCFASGNTLTHGLPFCSAHARVVIETMKSLQGLMPELHAHISRVAWPTAPHSAAPDPRD